MPRDLFAMLWGALLLFFAGSAAVAAEAQIRLTTADQAAAFRAAGFNLVGRQWKACGDPGTDSYTPGAIEVLRDIDGDGLPDAVITEGSTSCFGMTGTGFSLVSKRANGSWRLIHESQGIATILPRRAARGWPDIEIGGPGFCFPVVRWNGRAYVNHHYQYEGKPCRASR
ncbi:MAG: hypothetical protein ABIM50_00900 [Novosphingobium sp.]